MRRFKAATYHSLKFLPAIGIMTVSVWGVQAQETEIPSRSIYVVYDDSGSMYQDDAKGVPVDTWSKAKYSMEVFSAMLGPKDSMNIYYMSDYSPNGKKDGPKNVIEGKDPVQDNIQKIHDQRTTSGQTPFEAVEAAYEDLEKTTTDEKWLVVLTDGDFQKDGKVENDKKKVIDFMDDFFAKKDPDVNVAFLAIGEDTVPITEDRNKGIYFEKAADSTQILDKVTEISNRIFNTNRLDDIPEDGKFKLDIPMSELTVFVQGEGARVTGLVNDKGEEVGRLESTAKVAATDKSDNEAHKDNQPDASLQGEIASFEGQFPTGNYTVQTENAKNIEVYFKPNLDVVAYLQSSSGERIDDLSDLPAGDYTIHFELVSGIDQSKLPQKNIVTDSEYGVSYDAEVTNNGKKLQDKYHNGDHIQLEQGELNIDVTATYLKYNKATDTINHNIFKNKGVAFSPTGSEAWNLGGSLSAKEPLTIAMTVNGKAPTAQEWEQVQMPTVEWVNNGEVLLADPIVTKGETPGVFLISPDPDQKEWSEVPYKQATMKISMDEPIDQIPWVGQAEIPVQMKDTRPFWKQHGKWLKDHLGWLLGALALLAILIGYIPGVKKYLPKLPKNPNISFVPKTRGKGKKENFQGDFKSEASTLWIPYKPQEATLQVDVGDIAGELTKMKLKAGKNGRMELMNANDFDSNHIEIDGECIGQEIEEENQTKQPFTLTRYSEIKVMDSSGTYTCELGQPYRSDED